jgi:hypothetical protein
MRASAILLASALGLCGCGQPTQEHGGGGPPDLSIPPVVTPPDMLAPPTKCSPTDNLGDSQACGTNPLCPSGQAAVNIKGACKCFVTCDAAHQATCPCDRFCTMLTSPAPDGGAAGAACLPANGPGERCFTDANGNPYGNGICQQGTACIRTDAAGMFRYCDYLCFGSNSQCPQQTACDPVFGSMPFNVCDVQHAPTPKALGAACTIGTDVCALGAVCDGTTCKPECDGPKGPACASGTCTAVTDGARIVAYVCK